MIVVAALGSEVGADDVIVAGSGLNQRDVVVHEKEVENMWVEVSDVFDLAAKVADEGTDTYQAALKIALRREGQGLLYEQNEEDEPVDMLPLFLKMKELGIPLPIGIDFVPAVRFHCYAGDQQHYGIRVAGFATEYDYDLSNRDGIIVLGDVRHMRKEQSQLPEYLEERASVWGSTGEGGEPHC